MRVFLQNRLFSRRGFIQRASEAAKAAGLAGTLFALKQPGEATAASKSNPWAYDDSPFRRTDPKLIGFRKVAGFSCARSNPTCVALTKAGKLLIGAGRYLSEYSLDGTQIMEIELQGEPRCISASDDELLYVGMRERVELYDRKGKRSAQWETLPGKPYLTGVTLSATDAFLADAGNRVVWRCDPSGKIKGRIGLTDKTKSIPGFIVPSPFFSAVMGKDGLLRVTNPGRHRVETYTTDGDLEFAWGNAGAAIENFCGCCNPINLAMLDDGRVVTFEKGIPRVKIYATDGTLESVVAGAESFPENAKVCGPNDCTLGGLSGVVDEKGRICILDLVSATVHVMERNGKTTLSGNDK